MSPPANIPLQVFFCAGGERRLKEGEKKFSEVIEEEEVKAAAEATPVFFCVILVC